MRLEFIVNSIPALAAIFVERAEAAARRAIAERGRFSLVIPGGSVARAFLPPLSGGSIEWGRVDLFWTDERCVPADHPDSNYGLAEALLLRRIADGKPRVHRMAADSPDPHGAATAHERDLKRALGDPPRFDLVLLGVGPDGHVASLFPEHPALEEKARRVLSLDDAPKAPPRRMTLTLPALEGAGLICIAAFGGGKARVIQEALEAKHSDLPVARAARGAEETLYLLDPEAGALLRR